MEKRLIDLIESKGPLTGAEIKTLTNTDNLLLWQTCKKSKELRVKTIGIRYLRLDRQVKGFARLSPSILREFLTYSVVGLSKKPQSLFRRASQIISHINNVNRLKLELTQTFVNKIQSQYEGNSLGEQACFILAGDIVYNMAHDVPRPERSTGRLVRGSDIDLIVVLHDRTTDTFIKLLDEKIYQEKYRVLISPSVNEEIDYIVKRIERVREQARFDTFKHMVACKILQEGKYIAGNKKLFEEVQRLLKENGVPDKLDRLEQKAIFFRKEEEKYLIATRHDEINHKDLYFFYPAEESEEFE
ncbi:MAG TPA: hypothetical protein DDW17_06270 [Deltaproteobacteria bacterium]|nr:hypothetical protein [Deltaproteobacteria bacterium]